MAYLLRRLAAAAMILFGISVVTFLLLYLLPADPAERLALAFVWWLQTKHAADLQEDR